MKTVKYSISDNLKYLSSNLWRKDRPFYLWAVLNGVTVVALPLLGILLQKCALDGVLQRWEFSRFLRAVLLLTGLTVLVTIGKHCAAVGREHRQGLNRMRFAIEIERAFLRCPYRTAEDPKTQVELDKVSDLVTTSAPRTGVNGMHNGMYEVFVSLLGLAVFGTMVGHLHILLILLVLAGALVSGWIEKRSDAQTFALRMQEAPAQKKQEYFQNKLTKSAVGKDIRTYDCKGWLMGKLRGVMDSRETLQRKQTGKSFQKNAASVGIEAIQNGAAVLWITLSCLGGEIAISDFFVYLTAVLQLSEYTGKLIRAVNLVKYANLDVTEIRKFLDMEQEERSGEETPGAREAFEIRFEHVFFRYPGSDRDLLRDLDFTIKKGEKLALVGNNGAGKTTIVKLLCGFYAPTRGRILFGGQDISRMPRGELYEKISAVFQDIVLLPFSVAENVAPDPESEANGERIRKCLRQAGILEKLPDIHAKLDKRVYEDGLELSGGEKQKLVFARALYKDSGFLILDEPTAALDPLAESRMYQQYKEISENRTTVFISHRLASTSFCDRILLLEQGRIAETGTHEELLKKGGSYAEMFGLQSRYYREEETAHA